MGVPLMSLPKPMEEVTVWVLLLLFSFSTSSSLDRSSRVIFFLRFFFLCRGGSFLGKVNMGNMTSSMATAQSRNPLHLNTKHFSLIVLAPLLCLDRLFRSHYERTASVTSDQRDPISLFTFRRDLLWREKLCFKYTVVSSKGGYHKRSYTYFMLH